MVGQQNTTSRRIDRDRYIKAIESQARQDRRRPPYALTTRFDADGRATSNGRRQCRCRDFSTRFAVGKNGDLSRRGHEAVC